MAFNFAGKIKSKKDWNEFEEFFRKEIALASNKVSHLNAEITRLGTLLDSFKHADVALRAGYTLSESPDLKYLQKAKQQDELPMNTLDTVTAIDVSILKKPILDAIKAKRERNEWKIKRIRDLIDQYNNEITNINNIVPIYEDIISRMVARFSHEIL